MKKSSMVVSHSDQQRVSPKWWRPITGINEHDIHTKKSNRREIELVPDRTGSINTFLKIEERKQESV